MKRDMDLIRALLFYFENKSGPEPVEVPDIPGYEEMDIKYHLVLLFDAGLLRCEPVRSKSSERVIYVLPFELTWEGHEFLDTIRNKYIWDEINNNITNKGFASASMDIIKQLADIAIRKRLQLS